jgi:hypothetical protein
MRLFELVSPEPVFRRNILATKRFLKDLKPWIIDKKFVALFREFCAFKASTPSTHEAFGKNDEPFTGSQFKGSEIRHWKCLSLSYMVVYKINVSDLLLCCLPHHNAVLTSAGSTALNDYVTGLSLGDFQPFDLKGFAPELKPNDEVKTKPTLPILPEDKIKILDTTIYYITAEDRDLAEQVVSTGDISTAMELLVLSLEMDSTHSDELLEKMILQIYHGPSGLIEKIKNSLDSMYNSKQQYQTDKRK